MSTGVGSNFLLQGVFPTQGLKLGLPHYRQILYHLSHEGSRSWQEKTDNKLIRWHRSRWAEAWRTVLKNWDSTGKSSQVLGKHVKSPVTWKSHRTGGQGRFQSSSFWLPKELFLGSCGQILPAHQWTSFVAKWHGTTNLSFSPHLKKKMEFGKNGEKSLI